MKLASLKEGRDGHLVVVSNDLARYASAGKIAATLQDALDEWAQVEPLLLEFSSQLERGVEPGKPFDQTMCASPLPRAYQWADGSAYVNHVELVRLARGDVLPPAFWTDPLMYQGGSDTFLGPFDPIPLGDPSWGCDCEAEIAVIVDDVAPGSTAEEARGRVRLVMLANDVSLRNLVPPELAKGFGFFQSKPSSAFSPVAVTPDALGPAWRGGKLHLPLVTKINGKELGRPNAGEEMTFDFGQLISHAARTRPLGAGAIIGSGTVSNRDRDGSPGRPVAEGGRGYSCIAEQRMVEILSSGGPSTPFLTWEDCVCIEMFGSDGQSIFGRIDQILKPV